jgi:hypothetical protein
MQNNEKNDNELMTGSATCGCAPSAQGMAAMMSACCGEKSQFADCSAMVKSMKERVKDMPCCASMEREREPEGRKI